MNAADHIKPMHGIDGWDLVEYEFNEDTGRAVCLYEKPDPTAPDQVQTWIVERKQPLGPWHRDWIAPTGN